MKKSELRKGMLVAVASGTGRFDHRYGEEGSIRKAEVLEVGVAANPDRYHPVKDHTRVRLLGKPNSNGWGFHMREREDAEILVKTRNIWQPWESYAEGAKAVQERKAAERADRERWAAQAKDVRSRILALALTSGPAELDRRLSFSRWDGENAELDLDLLEALVAKAEGYVE